MREILFRGKQCENSKWINGYLSSKNTITIQTPCGHTDEIVICADTVGQFTGLTDKNGKKIFEGDIVRCGTGRICKVTFFVSPGVSGFDLVPIGGFDSPPPHNWVLFADTEIIGNIHDNPELLGGAEDGK